MSIIDTTPNLRQAMQVADLEPNPLAEPVTITDTTELRWFAEGPLPTDVHAWFAHGGSAGFVEHRSDTYRMDGRFDTGVKRRFGETLELKVRRSIGEQVVLSAGLAGRLEVWRRWSPAECMVVRGHNVPWVDVEKTVVKRRFSIDGEELPLDPEARAQTGAGCDVEIAAVSVADVEAWTFAFAAFGPIEGRRDALVASMRALVADGSQPDRFGPFFGLSSGYPKWLALVASRSGSVSTCELRRR